MPALKKYQKEPYRAVEFGKKNKTRTKKNSEEVLDITYIAPKPNDPLQDYLNTRNMPIHQFCDHCGSQLGELMKERLKEHGKIFCMNCGERISI